MAVAIDHDSAKLSITAYPKVKAPEILDVNDLDPSERGLILVDRTKIRSVPQSDQDEIIYFTSSSIEATGSVQLVGGAAEKAAGWEVGFLQAQWSETNWGYYRGFDERDGSLLLQIGKPPARPSQGCLDMGDETVKGIWYSAGRAGDIAVAGNKALPLTLTARFIDQPSDARLVIEQNTATGRANYLIESRTCVHFCTVFAALNPAGKFHPLRSFCWNVRHQATFDSTPLFNSGRHMTSISVVAAGTGSYVSPVVRGLVKDHRFEAHFVDRGPARQTCNRLMEAAYKNVRTVGRGRYESRSWRDFAEYR